MENLHESATDTIIAWIIFKRLLRKPKDTDAFKLGLIDKNFKILRKPKTNGEKKAMTLLDKLLFRIQNLLGSKIALIAYTGLMISSVDNLADSGRLLTNEEIHYDSNLDDMADDIVEKVLQTKSLSDEDRDIVMNRVVENLLKDV